MLKIRLMGTKSDIKWFGKILQRNPKVEVTKPVQRVSLKERLAEMRIRAVGGNIEKGMTQKLKGTEVSM